jgi:glycosyltransferase involved in cell wall biosynthesis
MAPRITIITPSFQQREYLEECLLSVIEQDYAHVEHIVVDGGSTDGSKELLERYSDKLTWWCSEPDHGQSDAINKGLARCTGDVVAWLNSDDMLLPGALQAVARVFEHAPGTIILEGVRLTLNTDGTRERMPRNDPADTDALFIAPHVNQQATFFNTAAVKAVGGVDAALHFTMDLDLWWRVLVRLRHQRVHQYPRGSRVVQAAAGEQDHARFGGFRAGDRRVTGCHGHQLWTCCFSGAISDGYGDAPRVRPSNAREDQAPTIERMILRFLVKWNSSIATADQFKMLKRVNELYGADIRLTDKVLVERWEHQRKGLVAPDWNTYRVGRKLGLWPA